MPWEFGGGPWQIYNQKDLRKFGIHQGGRFKFLWLPRW